MFVIFKKNLDQNKPERLQNSFESATQIVPSENYLVLDNFVFYLKSRLNGGFLKIIK